MAFLRTPSVRSSSTQTSRRGTRSTWEPGSRTARVTPRPASVSTSRPTAARLGRSWRGARASTAPCASGSGSCPLATGRSIGAIAIDPANANHIFIGTDVARHGSSSVNGGRFTPPGSAKVGLYESTDGGATFTAAEILTQDVTNPASATGRDFFRGGCSHIELYQPGTETQVYASFFDYGVLRRSVTLDGNSDFNQIFKSAGGGTLAQSPSSRTEFSLAPISRARSGSLGRSTQASIG